MQPLFTAFFTVGTLYQQEAARLRQSLDRLGLDHDIRGVASRGDWMKNSQITAEHICSVMVDHPDRPIVQLDADAVVWMHPEIFDQLPAIGMDVAVHYRQGRELLNGTVWFNCTDGARAVAQKYRELIISNPGCTNEQTMLAAAIDEMRDYFNLYHLPASYCWIHDIMQDDLGQGAAPVIEHLQASRESHQSPLLPGRRRRLAEIEAML